jgi:hypothetical protein
MGLCVNTHGDCAELQQHLSVLGITKDGTVPSRVGVSGLAPWEFLFSCAPHCLMGDTNNLQRIMDKWLI